MHKWESIGEGQHNLFKLMYRFPQYFGCNFQVVAMTSKVEQLKPENLRRINIVERSLEAQKRVFIPLLFDKGYITDVDKAVLDYSVDVFSSFLPKVDLYIYLTVPPAEALRRKRLRMRPEEEGLGIDYFNALQTKYDSWLGHELETPVWTIESVDIKVADLAKQILQFCSEW